MIWYWLFFYRCCPLHPSPSAKPPLMNWEKPASPDEWVELVDITSYSQLWLGSKSKLLAKYEQASNQVGLNTAFFSTLRVVEHIHWLDVGKVLTLNLCFFLKKFKKVRTFFKLGVHVEQPPKKIAEILGHFPHHSADGYGMHGNELPSHAAWRQRWRSDSHRGVVPPDWLRWISWRVFLPSVFLGFFWGGMQPSKW